jgi:hypothetical protein
MYLAHALLIYSRVTTLYCYWGCTFTVICSCSLSFVSFRAPLHLFVSLFTSMLKYPSHILLTTELNYFPVFRGMFLLL